MTNYFWTAENIRELGQLSTKNEAGQHFREWADPYLLDQAEEDGLIIIHRPVHAATGIAYGQEETSIEYIGPDFWDGWGGLREDWEDLLADHLAAQEIQDPR